MGRGRRGKKEGSERKLRSKEGKRKSRSEEQPGSPSLEERKMTSGKLPRQDKPSLLSRAFPRPAKARLRGTQPAESAALAVNRHIEALGYLQPLAPHAALPTRGGLLRLEQAERAGARLRTMTCPSSLLTHSGFRDPLAWDSDPDSAGLSLLGH